MRLVATFEDRDEARRFYTHLNDEGISSLFEIDGSTFQVWVHDEGDIEEAKSILDEFQKDPKANKYDVADDSHIPQPSTPVEISDDPVFLARMKELKLKMGTKSIYSNIRASVTKLTILLCTIIFVIQMFQHNSNKEKHAIAPIEQALMFESPSDQNGWEGLYPIMLNWPKAKPKLSAPMFTQIKHGEVWRLFTPALLHGNILHILFNMLWVWLLGKQIEERVGKFKYIIMMVIIGTVANVAQYVMIGPNFLGFSGVICGMAGFIWMRQRNAPWEGYPLHYTAVLFLAIFVLGIAGLQVVSFFLKLFGLATLPIQLANTAHLVGALTGILLAKLKTFARIRHER